MGIKVNAGKNLVSAIKVRVGNQTDGQTRNVSIGKVNVGGTIRIFWPDGDLEIVNSPVINNPRAPNGALTTANITNPPIGTTLTVNNGTWSVGSNIVTPTLFVYEWKRNNIPVGSNQNTYIPLSSDRGGTITCTVTATYQGKTASSNSFNSVLVATAPSAPVITSVLRGSNTLQVNWNPPSFNGNTPINRYQVRHRVSGTSLWSFSPFLSGSSTQYLISSLEINTTYEVQVQAANEETTSDWSLTVQQSTFNIPTNTAIPTISAIDFRVGRDVVGNSGSWNDGGTTIIQYRHTWQRSSSQSFTNPVTIGSPILRNPASNPNQSEPSAIFLPDNVGDYVRLMVEARNSAGWSSPAYSLVRGPITAPTPATPTNFAGLGNPGCGFSQFSWTSSTYATFYRIQISTNSGFTNIVETTDIASTASGTISGRAPSTSQPALSRGTYYFRITAGNNSPTGGINTTYSAGVSRFLEGALPAMSSPTVVSECGFLRVSWSSVPGATGYVLRKFNSLGTLLSTTTHGSSITTINDVDVSSGVSYNYRVAAENACASNSTGGLNFSNSSSPSVSPSSGPTNLSSAPPTVSPTSPLPKPGETITGSPGSWQGSPTLFEYAWQWGTSTSGSFNTISGETTTQFSAPSIFIPTDETSNSGGKFVRFRVRASNNCGATFAFSSAVQIRCGNIGNTIIRGARDLNCTQARTIVARSLTNNIVTITTSTNHGYSAGQNVLITGLGSTFNGIYQIRAVLDSVRFTYDKVNANVTSASVSGTATTHVSYTFSWNPSAGARRYYFELRRANQTTPVDNRVISGTSVSTFCLSVSEGIAWDFQVRGIPGTSFESNNAANSVIASLTNNGWG